MNTKHLIATSVLAVVGSGAFAAEYTDFPIPASDLTRAEVRAALERARTHGELSISDEIEQRGFAVAAPSRTREEVRAEAWSVARSNSFDVLSVGG